MSRVAHCSPVVRELASGVDALYLSGQGDLPGDLEARLALGKEAAQEAGDAVPFAFGGYDWLLQPSSLGKYRYRLEHPLMALGITPSERLPSFRVQFRAEALHSIGPRDVVGWIDSAFRNEEIPVSWTVSRIDLHADVQGWKLTGNDRHRFVCRADALATYEESGEFSGFTFGKRASKSVNGRIYDKTREVAGNGHDWWFDIWGDKYQEGSPVLRVEFELHRACLREMELGNPADVLDAVDRLWAYATNDWLSYRRRSAHQVPSRWPLAAEWRRVQLCSLAGDALPMARIVAGRTSGELRKLLPGLNGYVASLASWIGANTIEEVSAQLPYYLAAYEQQSRREFTDRVAEKRRRRT